MAGFKFEMNKGWERELQKAAEAGINDVAAEHQRALDGIHRQYSGRPVAEIKQPLKRAWERLGGHLSEPELTEYAQAISDGNRIKLEVQKPRW